MKIKDIVHKHFILIKSNYTQNMREKKIYFNEKISLKKTIMRILDASATRQKLVYYDTLEKI